jgi:hypothetical protein
VCKKQQIVLREFGDDTDLCPGDFLVSSDDDSGDSWARRYGVKPHTTQA